jgi:hypothetical protein
MVAVSNPFGLRCVYHPSGLARARTALTDGIASGFGSAILLGQPIRFTPNQGTIAPITTNSQDWLGVFDGVEWTDTTGRRRVNNSWISGTTFIAGTCRAYFIEDPDAVYEIQSDATMAQTTIYNQVNFTTANLAAGSTTPGISQATAAATAVGSGVQGQMRVLDRGPQVNNAWGDAFVILRVQNAQSQQRANKVAI